MRKGVVSVWMFLLSLSIVSAFGVSTPYWEENPLKLAPGESMIVELKLQNMVGNEDVKLRAEITDGGGIANLVNPNPVYLIPTGRDDVVVKVKIDVPEDYTKGGKRDIRLSFKQVSEKSEGMVAVSGGATSRITVFIVNPEESVLYNPEPESEGFNGLIYFLIIVVVIIIISIILLRQKKEKVDRKPNVRKKVSQRKKK